jgi:hypothetical protein
VRIGFCLGLGKDGNKTDLTPSRQDAKKSAFVLLLFGALVSLVAGPLLFHAPITSPMAWEFSARMSQWEQSRNAAGRFLEQQSEERARVEP